MPQRPRLAKIRSSWILAFVVSLPALHVVGEPAQKIDFAREILPILSNKCFVCHGPDVQDAEFLRLDTFAAATSDRGGYRAIDPEAPTKSELLRRIHDADDPMPPEDAEKHLTAAERELLDRWVRQGGDYAEHWAFVPPRKSTPPPAKGLGAIDAFVRARLTEGVTFAPAADSATLARRAALVLTGLPPEPAQLEAYLDDRRAGAFERFVDELMASRRYGEHQARYWLDAVRYGDTHGLHLDNRRGIYPYRDWVVRAFNENLPLDEFLTWQLAGDLLRRPTLEQQVATGFVRMNPTTAEGGVLPEEFQAKNNFDRVETLGTVLLGMSLNCARCHTHKYDPIPQTEYYRLLAFFNSTAESSLDGNSYTYGPTLPVPANQNAWDEWDALRGDREALFAQAKQAIDREHASLLKHAKATLKWSAAAWSRSDVVAADAPRPATGKDAKGLPGVSKEKLPKAGNAIWVAATLNAPTDQGLTLTFSGGPGSDVFLDGESVGDGQRVDKRSTVVYLKLAEGKHSLHIKMVGTKDESAIEVRLQNAWEAFAKAKGWEACSDADRMRLLTEPVGPLARLGLQGRSRELAAALDAAKSRFTTTLVARERQKPRPTRLLRRGEYNLPAGEPLEPGVLTVMGEFPEDAPRDRRGLAAWLTSRKHPVVARVLVNRMWQRVFGEGLVRTPEDFGLQGEQPTHPKLLDWLAVELQDSGWNMKHLLRLMVLSRTFQQNSTWREDIDDPENRLLARGPSHRLDAEVIRDLGLWASGLLRPVMGGEGVKPYQPEGMWRALAHPASNTKQYVRDKGERLYHRSLYVYWKRTSPHPMMTLFDAPSREASCVKRSRTNTALQSLGLLNETQRVEMARALAERLLREADDDASRINRLFKQLACRNPTEVERRVCTSLLTSMRARYRDARDDANALLSVGDASRDEALDATEHAAWTQVAITVLASDMAMLLY